jgi:large subunit ribosomal protein L24
MQKKLNIKKGDQVMVIAGEAKGQQGKVLSVNRESMRAVVEGLNMVSKHAKPNAKNPQGGIVKKEAPIHISNLMLVDGKGVATRIARQKDKSGNTIRFSKKSKEAIK